MALTALQVKAAKPGDRLSDGGGLRLDVDRNGNRSWVMRYKSPVTGKERYFGIGSARDVGLAEARGAAEAARALIRQGLDPIEHRKAARAEAKVEASKAITFRDYADRFVASREATWRNPAHRQQWRNTLRDYAHPRIGDLSLSAVDTPAILNVLRPIWNEKPETASRLRGRLEVILSAAKAEGLRTGENPAAWRGHLDQIFASRKKVRAIAHHPALPYSEIPKFMAALRADESTAAALLQFIILTAARFSEAARAEKSEIKGDVWVIPAARMKAGREHRVPLSDAALAIITPRMKGEGALLFPSVTTGRALSDVAIAKVIRRHTTMPATTHGFRSTFRDWAGDTTDFPREIAEAALAHAIGDETESAYRRGDALEKRRKLLQEWAAFCGSMT